MKFKIDYNGYDTLLQPTDWRYSAATVGLVKYLDFHKISYCLLEDSEEKPENYIPGFDGVMYNQSDITEEAYLLFAESYFEKDMTHLTILKLLDDTEFDDEKIKHVNDLVKQKTVLKNLLGKVKFDGINKDIYEKIIADNRLNIIKGIFRYGQNLYADYCNKNLLFTQQNAHCRLVGYNVDEGRKTKCLGYCFSKDSFIGNDVPEFDFIPFAFSNPEMHETYFINNNFSVSLLVKTNVWLGEKLASTESRDSRDNLLKVLKNSDDFMNYDVEIITKSRDEEIYKTLFVHYERLKALKQLGDKSLSFKYELSKENWLNLEKEVCENCLNGVYLDELILLMLKLSFKDNIKSSIVKSITETLIDIDQLWKGNDIMKEIESAKKMGFIVSQELIRQNKKNKVNSYKQKLIGALSAHDYDRVNEIILNLSAYVGIEFPFFYSLLENAEENKNIALAFASALYVKDNNN